jgi:hypothetical protein
MSRLPPASSMLMATAAFVLASGLSVAQSPQPRPSQLPPAAGPGQGGPGGPSAPGRSGPLGTQGPPAAPVKPYKALAVTLPARASDPSFEAFRKQLAGIAARKDRAALARVVAMRFFVMGGSGDKADKRKPGIDNLAAAIDLDGKDNSGWDALAAAAAQPTLAPVAGQKGILCAPAMPNVNDRAFEQLTRSTGTDVSDWGYPVRPDLEVRATARPDAPVIEKLGLALVRIMPDEEPARGQPAAPANAPPAMRVATPSGKTGFVPADAVNPMVSDQFCYSKDASGWKIAGYVSND